MSASTGSLKVIALISGGKDSLFSILHCLAAGHEVVALANLHPPSLGSGSDAKQVEDLDSFMYQTVGHHVIPLYAEALGLPLFRKEITGFAVDTGREYSLRGHGDDETEDLVPLLERAMHETGANAVSTGAILSTYQRTRVEAIAIRLGLTPLSYLWQYMYLPPYRQTSLLDDMRAVGQESRIIKVASGGLDQSFLWQDVTDTRTIARMRKQMHMFGGGEGGALIGEGGEFETLAMNGPAPLWKKKLLADYEQVRGDGSTAFARLKAARLGDQDSKQQISLERLRIPSLIDDEFQEVLHAVQLLRLSLDHQDSIQPSHTDLWTEMIEQDIEVVSMNSASGFIHLTNIMSAPFSSATDQMTDIVHQILFKLQRLGCSPSDITHTTILLREMSSFAAINPIYGSLFGSPNPPSRVTVSCGDLLPQGIHVIVSLVLNPNKDREGLHVQSRSYWAPANIGPYSQAISMPIVRRDNASTAVPRHIHVAGQIPLVPASMKMVTADLMPWAPFTENTQPLAAESKDFIAQSVLSLQHLWRIGRAMNVCAWTGAVAYLSKCSVDLGQVRASVACATWSSIHEILENNLEAAGATDDYEAEDIDVWDIKNRVAQLVREVGDTRSPLPDFSKIDRSRPSGTAWQPSFAVMVNELPRGADIEWCSTGIAVPDDARAISYVVAKHSKGYIAHDCHVVTTDGSKITVSYLSFEDSEALEAFANIEQNEKLEVLSVYATQKLPQCFWDRFGPAMFVPSYGIWQQNEMGKVQLVQVLVVARRDIAE